MSQEKAVITVLGAGSWGSTIAAMLACNGVEARIWNHSQEEINALLECRHPPGVPELSLPEMMVTNDLGKALKGSDAFVLVTPAQVATKVCEQIQATGHCPPIAIIASKGIDLQSLRPLSEVVEEALPNVKVSVVSGPCIAREVAQGIPTSVVAACTDEEVALKVQQWFVSRTFRVYTQEDILGVEYGGAYKNVIAIAAGVCDGLGFGANSKSALLTRGLAEMRRFVRARGGDDLTTAGLAGLGDLCVTCFSPHSRNRRFGEALGSGKTPEEAIAAIGETVEGAPTAQAVVRIADEMGLSVPVAEAVTKIIAGEWSPKEAVEQLMTRELKQEF